VVFTCLGGKKYIAVFHSLTFGVSNTWFWICDVDFCRFHCWGIEDLRGWDAHWVFLFSTARDGFKEQVLRHFWFLMY
jgi:hypothetical protein